MTTTAYAAGLAATFILGAIVGWLTRTPARGELTGAATALRQAYAWIDELHKLVAEANSYEAYGPWPRNTHVLSVLCDVNDWRRNSGKAGGSA